MSIPRLAVITDPDEANPPSNKKTLYFLSSIASKYEFDLQILAKDELELYDIDCFDAYFLRCNAQLDHFSYNVALHASQFNIPCIDAYHDIETCNDPAKVIQALARSSISIPNTIILHPPWDLEKAAHAFGYPLVFRTPHHAIKADREAELFSIEGRLLTHARNSPILAQEYIDAPTYWNAGILKNEVIYLQHCRHHRCMIYKPKTYPYAIVELATYASTSIGKGLYNISIRESHKGPLVTSVTPSPQLNHGVHDKYGQVWPAIFAHFRTAIERRVQNEDQ